MPHLVDVALPVAVDKTFTYLVPPDLEHAAVSGARVIVPFGRKYATGLIVALPASSTVKGLRPVTDIVDERPVVSGELLSLCKWIAEYYIAPLGEVLKAALPHGFASSKRIVRLSPEKSEISQAPGMGESLSPARAKLLQFLLRNGPTLSTELGKRAGIKNINAVLNEMERAGLLHTEEVFPGVRQKVKLKEFIRLDVMDAALLTSELHDLPPRRKKAAQLLNSLQWLKEQGTAEVTLQDLLKKSGAGSAVVKPFLASGLLKVVRREVIRAQDFGTEEQTLSIVLNESQKAVLQALTGAIDAGGSKTFLLHGVTGSGKTQVYIEAIRYCLEKGKTAIVLVPEISLTPQIVRRFKSHFAGQAAVVHSRMSAGERQDVWRLALRGTYKIVIGPRSAVFAPLDNLGLIVVDEEHEASYKQYDATPRYHARDIAVVRGAHAHAVVVLGSATPSAESYQNAVLGKYEVLTLPHRIDQVPMPAIAIVNMAEERKKAYSALKESLPEEQRGKLKDFTQSALSEVLRQKIEQRLTKKEGIILLQNRRGFAPFIECPDCGYTETCERCSITLTYHLAKKHLRCHYCGLVRQPHTQCPQCKGTNIRLLGIGTQRVEQELGRLFPTARVLRMDLDTTRRKGAHDRILRKFGDGDADILLGTQMVAKGLDFPRVTLVGVISADTQMLLPDFRASERTFQLLTQVAGRSGRSTLQGEVVIQTHQPQHYSLRHVVDHNVVEFYKEELEERREVDYPPFSRLALVETKGKNEEEVRKQSERFARLLKEPDGQSIVLGPAPAVIAKINNQYRWHIIIKSPKSKDQSGVHLHASLRNALARFLPKAGNSVRLTIDIDPVGLM